MSVRIIEEENKITAFLSGEIDHHVSPSIRKDIDLAIIEKSPEILALDFSQVSFMDSSGIGLIMGRYKVMSEHGGKVLVQNPPPGIKKVMKLSGIEKLAKICSTNNKTDDIIKTK